MVSVNHRHCFSRRGALLASMADLIRSSMMRMEAPKPVAVPPGEVAR